MNRSLMLTVICLAIMNSPAEAQPRRAEAEGCLRHAVDFYLKHCSRHGGYVWRYSRDLKLSEGEAETDANVIWVQPPGTPAVGIALLDAYRVTSEPAYLEGARRAAEALMAGQLHSGGWYYSITFAPGERRAWGYRDNPDYPISRTRKNKQNITTLDDDTTPAAVRFLVLLDRQLDFQDKRIHEASLFALDALVKAQHPNGGWSQNWDVHPGQPKWPVYPVTGAAYPPEWSRKWMNDWTGKYYLNDNVLGNMLATMLLAWEVYGNDQYLNSARRAGDFLLRAQMPDPQPAWAQQYDEHMFPVWDRKFEPPAIASDESQESIEALLLLHEKSGDEKYLQSIPRALKYLRNSLLPDGQLARFYELQTNRPLYFEVREGVYHLTYDDSRLPTHYAFKIPSRIDRLEARYQQALLPAANPPGPRKPSDSRISTILETQDERGAWVQPGTMRGFRKASPEGVIESETFLRNVRDLCDYLENVR